MAMNAPPISSELPRREGLDGLWDRVVIRLVRDVVDAVRYEPQHTALVLACGGRQPEVPQPIARWWADVRVQPSFLALSAMPHAVVRRVATAAAQCFGPTGSAIVRWLAGATAALVDHVTAHPIERSLRARAHPGLLVPHPHELGVLAVDMRGFSNLTRELHDTQYLSDLIGEYLTTLTRVVEGHGGVVFQYTGDGLLAVFLPELVGVTPPALLARLIDAVCPALHGSFEGLRARWQADWQRAGRPSVRIGLGVGLSFGPATIGLLGAAGKKQIGVIGEPVNVAAYLCSQSRAGSVLVDCGSFTRAGAAQPAARIVRLRSKKPHQRINTVCLVPTTARA
jgi:class 3 adenylate cyclase